MELGIIIVILAVVAFYFGRDIEHTKQHYQREIEALDRISPEELKEISDRYERIKERAKANA
jgi:hypothetical protein